MSIDTVTTIIAITVAYFIIIERRLSRLEKDIAVLKNSIKMITHNIPYKDNNHEND